jgi:hypothetical protein
VLLDRVATALDDDDVSHELFPVGLTDWLLDGDDVAKFEVLESRPGAVTVAVDGDRRTFAPDELARAGRDA